VAWRSDQGPGSETIRKTSNRIDVEMLLHPETLQFFDEVQCQTDAACFT